MSANRWPNILSIAAKVAIDYRPDEVVPHKVLCALAEVSCLPANRHEQARYMSFCSTLQKALWREHSIHIDSVFGVGYRLVPDGERVVVSVEDVRNFMRRGRRLMRGNLTHLPAGIPGALRKESADALAKLGTVTSLMRRSFARTARSKDGDEAA